MKIKKHLLLLIILILQFIITGCWDSVELDKRRIIVGMSIDRVKGSKKIKTTISSLIPKNLGTPSKSENATKNSVFILTTEGNSLTEALRANSSKTSAVPYLAKNRILIFSEDIARQGLKPLLEYFLRYPDFNSRTYILIAKGSALNILKWKNDVLPIPSDYIIDMLQNRNNVSTAIVEDLHEFIMKINSETTSPSTARINIIKNLNSNTRALDISYTSIFKKDKLIGCLKKSETRGLAWITNSYGHGFVEAKNVKNNHVDLTQYVLRSNTKIIPKLINGKIEILLKVTEEGNLRIEASGMDLNSPKTIDNLEEQLSKSIKNDIEACLNKAQKQYKSDIFGFGEAVHKKNPSLWKTIKNDWTKDFPKIHVAINVTAKIKNIGSISNINN